MLERIIGAEAAGDIMFAGMLSGMQNEKQAESAIESLEKQAFNPIEFIKGLWNAGAAALSMYPKAVVAGLGTGAVAGAAYNTIKNRMASDDPQARLNNRIEALYVNKKRELDDAKWMSRIRSIRDDLKRGYKKMPAEEYEAKYNELVSALKEKESV